MPGPQTIRDYVAEQAAKYKVPPELAFAVIDQESGGVHQPAGGDVRTSNQGAHGFFQLLPSTAYGEFGLNPDDPLQNVEAGIRYLRQGLDRNGNDVAGALSYYHGGPDLKQHGPKTQAYTQAIMAKLRAQLAGQPAPAPAAKSSAGRGQIRVPTAEEMAAKTAGPAGGPTDSVVRAPTWGENHPYLNSLVQGFDPNELEGRQNIAGGLGGIAGGVVGGIVGGLGGVAAAAPTGELAAPAAVPAGVLMGRRVGAALGASVFGAGEQALVEETGLGKTIQDWLPGETNVAVPPPAPDSTMVGRIATAGAKQGLYDVVGQGVGKGLGFVGKTLVQSRVGRYALQQFEKEAAEKVASAQVALEGLQAAGEALKLRTARLGRAVTDMLGYTRQTAGDTATAKVAGIAAGTEGKVAQAQTMAEAAVLGAKQKAEQTLGVTKAAGERAQQQAAETYTGAIGAPPPQIPAGRAVVEAYQGPIQAARDAAGQAVEDAAASGPDVDISALKAEAHRIYEQELLPPERSFPRRAAEVAEGGTEEAVPDVPTGLLDPSGRPIMRPGAPPPPPPDAVAALSGQVAAAQTQETIKHPAMGVIDRILNAPDTVPFRDAHLWKSQLQRAIADTYDASRKSQVQSITQHLAGQLRATLGGHEPYNVATEQYGKIARLFEEGYGSKIAQVARSEPEKIVQMIRPEDPSAAAMLVEALTHTARRGGGPEGAAQGRQALQAVQHAWLHENVLQGGIQGLGERLSALRARPEFIHAFLGDETAQATLKNLEEQASGYARLVTDAKLQLAAQALKNEAGVATTKAEGKQAVRTTRRAGQAELRTQRATNLTAKRQLEGTTKDIGETVRRLGEDKAAALRKQIEQAQIDLRAGKQPSPELQAFLDSTLTHGAARRADQAAADLVTTALSFPHFWGVRSAARLLHGASDRDLLLYAARSPTWTRNFVKHVVTSAKPGWVFAQGTRAALGPPPEPPRQPEAR